MSSQKNNSLMDFSNAKEPNERALLVNLDESVYGTFAEIGAGQEVARHFFQAGKASQTIAKTISAYDMIYSDEIYGKEKSGRYVCESRLLKMLDKEYQLLLRRLDTARGNKTKFFAFANTVATGDQNKKYTHGWTGVRFQHQFKSKPNDIVLHVRLLDKYRLQQQQTLGILGVNLVYLQKLEITHHAQLIHAITLNIKPGQLAIDYIRVDGDFFKSIDNHLLSLELVKKDLTEAVLFSTDMNVVSISDTLFDKPLLVQRGNFRPITNTHIDILDKSVQQFKKDFKEQPMTLLELTMHQLSEDGDIDENDFLSRIKTICSTGNSVLVSNFYLFYRLKLFLRQFSKKPLIITMGASHLDRLLNAKFYSDLEGGLLEGMGKLLDEKSHLYVYPHKTEQTCSTAQSFFPEKKYLPIWNYLKQQNWIQDISGCDQISEYKHSEDILKMLKSSNKAWEKWVPSSVKELIKKEKLFLK